MTFPYGKTTWVDNSTPAINAANLNKIEAALAAAYIKLNVKDYGAVGDGTTDDTTAITNAINALPAGGGTVFFPPGVYKVTATLPSVSGMTLEGCHSLKYELSTDPTSPCKIRAGTGLTGSLFAPGGTVRGVSFKHLAFSGNNIGSNIHCFRMPEDSTVTGEMMWTWDNCTIMGWTGSGVAGRLHVGDFIHCHIINNGLTGTGWGCETVTGTNNKWTDVKMIGGIVAYNRAGNVYLGGGTGQSGAIEFTSTRFERAGCTSNPLAPAATDAPGVKIDNAIGVEFANCTNDANTGDGYLVTRQGAGVGNAVGITWVGGDCRRNGVGANSGSIPTNRGNFRFEGIDASNLVQGCSVIGTHILSGKSDDAGGGLSSPAYGFYLNYAYFCTYIPVWENTGGVIGGVTGPYGVGAGGIAQLYQSQWYDAVGKVMTIPAKSGAPATILGDAATNNAGQMYLDLADNKIKVYISGGWKATAALV
jgi:hypothetical protein